MTNKVKPFYIRITDDMTPQMVQNAFDKCVDAGAVASECIKHTERKHKYSECYSVYFGYFGINNAMKTFLGDKPSQFHEHAQEINLDQLDEWLGLKAELDWEDEDDLPPVGSKVMTSFTEPDCDSWCDFHGPSEIIAYHGDYVWIAHHGKFNRIHALADIEFEKPETPEQKAERERIENGKAIYDLMSSIEMNHDIAGTPNTWAELRDDWQSVYIQLAESVGYRKQ